MQAASVRKPATGELPNQWKLFLLDDVAVRGSGHTPDKKHPEYWNGEIKWISLRDTDRLDKLYISDTTAKITPLGIAHSSAVVHPAGTVVLSRDAGVGKSSIMTCEMAVSQHFMAWHCGPSLNNVFLYYWLQSRKSEFERIAMGNTIKTIGLSYFRALRLLLPPIEEQLAIAAALSDVDALINSLDRLIAKKRDIKQATMQQLLTGKTRLPGFTGDWETHLLVDMTELITKGTTPTSIGRTFTERGINFIKIESVGEDGEFLPDKIGFIDELTHEFLKRSQLKAFDVLISIAGALGRTTIVPPAMLPANTNQALAIIRVAESSNLAPRYLFYFLRSEAIRSYIKAISVQGAQANLSLQNIADIEIRFGTRAEQNAIIHVLDDIHSELAGLEQHRGKMRLIKQGMMQELLTGRTRLI